MKKLFFLFFMTLLPLAASADVVEIGGIYYNLDSKAGIAEVTRIPNGYSGSIDIPDKFIYEGIEYSVTSIGDGAFHRCSSLTSVTIPNSVTSIGERAFYYCTGLTSITIPNSVTSIGDGAFYGCSSLTSITIPNSVTSIGDETFLDCSGLTSITIPNSVTSIGERAFGECRGLTSVTIPNSVTSIGESAFYYCSGLTSVTIPNSVTSIGRFAFAACSSLTSVTIPNSVTSIEIGAFSGCSSLTSVTIPNSVTSIGDGAFHRCSSLTSVTIPNSVTSIGNGAFYGCSGLTSVTLHCQTIGTCFRGNSSIKEIIIGEEVTSIESNAFNGCTSLMTVKSYIAEPFNISRFSEETYRNGTLYVPAGTKDLYIRFDGWREFLKIEEMEDEDPTLPKCATPTIAYEKGELVFSCDTEGAIFVSEIKVSDAQKRYDSRVRLSSNYIITVYAMASGYADSEVATAMITWRDGRPQMAGFSNIELRGDQTSDTNGDGTIDVGDIMAIINQMARNTAQ